MKAEYKEAIDSADTKYNDNDTDTVKVKAAAPSLDAIKARASKKETV